MKEVKKMKYEVYSYTSYVDNEGTKIAECDDKNLAIEIGATFGKGGFFAVIDSRTRERVKI